LHNISIIAAVDENYLIGKENRLPWNIKEDLHHFRELTIGHPVVMGKNTWLSLGKPLDGRINVILTHDKSFQFPGCIVANSIEQVLTNFPKEEVFVIGGACTYQQFLALANRIYLTRIKDAFEGDVYFPVFDWSQWEMVFFEQKDTESGYRLSFEKWIKKQK
jgi:dihydrofolate reductase